MCLVGNGDQFSLPTPVATRTVPETWTIKRPVFSGEMYLKSSTNSQKTNEATKQSSKEMQYADARRRMRRGGTKGGRFRKLHKCIHLDPNTGGGLLLLRFFFNEHTHNILAHICENRMWMFETFLFGTLSFIWLI